MIYKRIYQRTHYVCTELLNTLDIGYKIEKTGAITQMAHIGRQATCT